MINHIFLIKKPIASSCGQPAMMAKILLSVNSGDCASIRVAYSDRKENF